MDEREAEEAMAVEMGRSLGERESERERGLERES